MNTETRVRPEQRIPGDDGNLWKSVVRQRHFLPSLRYFSRPPGACGQPLLPRLLLFTAMCVAEPARAGAAEVVLLGDSFGAFMVIVEALVTDSEVERVVRHLKTQGSPDYEDDVTREDGDEGPGPDGPLFEGAPGGADGVYNQAIQIVAKDGKASTSYLQRKLQIGYNSAAKLIERMEQDGLISSADHVGRRQVLMGRGGVDGNEPTGF